MIKFIIILIFFSVFLSGNTNNLKEDNSIKKIISQMTIQEKIGQLFNIAIVGKKLKPEYKRFIEKYQIGGITLFNYNIKNKKQLKNFIKELQSISKIPMFISVDQEGGRITRYKKGNFLPPSPYLMGKLNDKEIVKKVGEYTAKDLLSVGINLNIAPVADILSTYKNKAIFDRSFGENTNKVSELVSTYMESLQKNGVIAVIKHFAGQGSIKQDTHKTLPYSKIKNDLLFKRDLLPFKSAIDKNLVNVVMSSHVIFANIDHKYPATLSKKVLGDILRTQLNYDGIIFTDGLEMMAILKTYGLEKATLLALKGEVDVVTINWDLKNVKRAVHYIEKAIKEKKISENLIDKKLYRILKVKKKFLYNKKNIKSLDKKNIDKFLISTYKKGLRFQNIKKIDLKNKVIYSNMKSFKKNKNINYFKNIPQNISNSIIIISKLSSINHKLYKKNVIIYLGADIAIRRKKYFKGIILNENNKYTRNLAVNLTK
jgi:beta-N-acetylhexosaminidase